MRFGKKIGIRAFETECADAAQIIGQGQSVKAARARSGEVLAEFLAGLGTLSGDPIIMLGYEKLFLYGDPLQQVAKPLDVGIASDDLLDTGDSLQLRASMLLQRNSGALVRNDRLWAIHHGLQNALQVQGGCDLFADLYQRLEDFDLAFGLQQAGIVQGASGGFADSRQQEKVFLFSRHIDLTLPLGGFVQPGSSHLL